MNINIIQDEKALKAIAIYGANASGKSNLLRAIATALHAIRRSNTMQVTDRYDMIQPFGFDPECTSKPSKFEFTFVATDKIKYVYGFSADSSTVYEEYLYCYLTSKPTMIFDRTEVDHYRFRREDKKSLLELTKRNSPNKFFLSTATAWNYSKTLATYKWLTEQIDTFEYFVPLMPSAMEMFEQDKDGSIKAFTTKLLKQADINISDYDVKIKSNIVPFVNYDQIPLSANQQQQMQVVEKNGEIFTDHLILGQHRTEKHVR